MLKYNKVILFNLIMNDIGLQTRAQVIVYNI